MTVTEPASTLTTTDRVYFGGKGNKAYPWTPMPYMNEYLLELESGEEPRSPDYLRAVRAGLGHFANYCASESIKHPNEIKREHLLRFQAHITTLTRPSDGQPLSLRYRQQVMKYVRGWINWLEGVRYIDANPWYKVRVGRVPKQPKPLEPGEIVSLFDAHRRQAFRNSPFVFHRREVILSMLFGWGLRIHELQALNVTQVALGLDYVTVRNKGGGTKVEPYGDAMKGVVTRWLGQRAKHARYGEDALIIDQVGGRLGIARIREVVKACGENAGLSINPHRLRDSFGTTMLDGDVEVERLQKLLGHADGVQGRAMTLAYSRINDPKLKESHDRVMNPILQALITGQMPQAPQ